MPLIIIAEDILSPDSWERVECDDLLEYLTGRWEQWPATARLYHGQVAVENDVTPRSFEDIARLKNMEGPWWVIVYPGAVFGAIVQLVIAIAMMVISYILAPKPAAERNRVAQSPNNGLSERTNQARINGRIPDIYGTVRSTPDLIANPFKCFEEHQEVEYSCMCVGRGAYAMYSNGVYDGDTRCNAIAGMDVEIYDPNTSPNSGHDPVIQIGSPITEPMWISSKSNSVNGQTLRPPNDRQVNGSEPSWHTPGWVSTTPIRFVYPNEIQIDPLDNSVDFTDYFISGDPLNITNAAFNVTAANYTVTASYDSGTGNGTLAFTGFDPSSLWSASDVINIDDGDFTYGSDPPSNIDLTAQGYTVASVTSTTLVLDSPEAVVAAWESLDGITTESNTVTISEGSETLDLGGDYTVTSVSNRTIVLDDPESVNADWLELDGNPSDYIYPTLLASGYRWVGPFDFSTYHPIDAVWLNIVAPNGLYKLGEDDDEREDVQIIYRLWKLDDDGVEVGTYEESDIHYIEGSASFHGTRAKTIKITPAISGWEGAKNFRVQVARKSITDESWEGTVVDEIKWQTLLAMTAVDSTDFGDVTMIHSRSPATDGALAIKERKLNLIVQRKVPIRVSDSTFTTELSGTDRADEIISAICLDSKIGRRTTAEIDFDSIYDTIHDVEVYFGTDVAIEFNYTFDDDGLSFQDHIASVATAVFCQAYRRGNQIKLLPEIANESSTLLFNHRNKIPRTETRSVTFGRYNDHDGVSIDYVDPDDDSVVTYHIPDDMSATSPKNIEIIGIRNKLQAYWHAWREWNKITHQNTVTEFEATQEAYLLPLKDRILVADNTRSGTQDGEVLEQDGLQLTLSQPVTFAPGAAYTIFLQLPDGTVESRTITAGSATNQVILSSAPSQTLAIDSSLYARSTYLIVSDQDARGESAFLVAEKEPQSRWTCKIKAINYDSRYYANDTDYINEIVDIEGDTI